MSGANNAAVIKALLNFRPTRRLCSSVDALMPADVFKTYPNAIYNLAWDRPPEVYNDRLRTTDRAWQCSRLDL